MDDEGGWGGVQGFEVDDEEKKKDVMQGRADEPHREEGLRSTTHHTTRQGVVGEGCGVRRRRRW